MESPEASRIPQAQPALRPDPLVSRFAWPLILLAIALLPFGRLFNIPVMVMTAWGALLLATNAELRWDFRVRLMWLLFLSVWLPGMISLPWAVDPQHASRTLLSLMRVPFMAAFIILALASARPINARTLQAGLSIVLTTWTLDALLQWITGRNVLGQPWDGVFLTGLFHPDRSIGLFIALLLPVHLEALRHWSTAPSGRRSLRIALAIIIALASGMVVILAGTRNGWMVMGAALPLWGLWRWSRSRSPKRHLVLAAAVLGAILTIPLIAQVPGVRERLTLTSELLRGDREAIDRALTRRLPIWSIGLRMAQDHWLTGVGPRGYRYRYAEYADDDTPWIGKDGIGAAHPHLILIEIAAETGVIGLLGYAILLLLLVRALSQNRDTLATPWFLAALLALMPINSYKAFFGTEWMHITWLLIAVAIALHGARDADTEEPAP